VLTAPAPPSEGSQTRLGTGNKAVARALDNPSIGPPTRPANGPPLREAAQWSPVPLDWRRGCASRGGPQVNKQRGKSPGRRSRADRAMSPPAPRSRSFSLRADKALR
jgi:hypothetical protein